MRVTEEGEGDRPRPELSTPDNDASLAGGRGMVFVLGRAGAIDADKASCRERGDEVRAA